MPTYYFTRAFKGEARISIEAESEEAARARSDADPDQGDWELPRTLRDCTDVGELAMEDWEDDE